MTTTAAYETWQSSDADEMEGDNCPEGMCCSFLQLWQSVIYCTDQIMQNVCVFDSTNWRGRVLWTTELTWAKLISFYCIATLPGNRIKFKCLCTLATKQWKRICKRRAMWNWKHTDMVACGFEAMDRFDVRGRHNGSMCSVFPGRGHSVNVARLMKLVNVWSTLGLTRVILLNWIMSSPLWSYLG